MTFLLGTLIAAVILQYLALMMVIAIDDGDFKTRKQLIICCIPMGMYYEIVKYLAKRMIHVYKELPKK